MMTTAIGILNMIEAKIHTLLGLFQRFSQSMLSQLSARCLTRVSEVLSQNVKATGRAEAGRGARQVNFTIETYSRQRASTAQTEGLLSLTPGLKTTRPT